MPQLDRSENILKGIEDDAFSSWSSKTVRQLRMCSRKAVGLRRQYFVESHTSPRDYLTPLRNHHARILAEHQLLYKKNCSPRTWSYDTVEHRCHFFWLGDGRCVYVCCGKHRQVRVGQASCLCPASIVSHPPEAHSHPADCYSFSPHRGLCHATFEPLLRGAPLTTVLSASTACSRADHVARFCRTNWSAQQLPFTFTDRCT